MQTRIKLEYVKVYNFDPKTTQAELEICFNENGEVKKFSQQYILKNPDKLLDKVFIAIKSKDRVLPAAPLSAEEMLEMYSPIIIEKPEETEEKMFNFLRFLCEKASRMKKTTNASEYMQLFNEFKTISLYFDQK